MELLGMAIICRRSAPNSAARTLINLPNVLNSSHKAWKGVKNPIYEHLSFCCSYYTEIIHIYYTEIIHIYYIYGTLIYHICGIDFYYI